MGFDPELFSLTPASGATGRLLLSATLEGITSNDAYVVVSIIVGSLSNVIEREYRNTATTRFASPKAAQDQ